MSEKITVKFAVAPGVAPKEFSGVTAKGKAWKLFDTAIALYFSAGLPVVGQYAFNELLEPGEYSADVEFYANAKQFNKLVYQLTNITKLA